MALKFEYYKETRTATVCGVEDQFCEQIVIPSTVEYYRKKYDVVAIEEEAFKDCIKLKSVTIPDSVTKIGVRAFQGCRSLTSVTIPNSVTKICESAFSCCSSLTSITIPNSVTVIGYGAFSGCSNLTSITIPDSVTVIGDNAFSGCSSLKEFKGKFAADKGRCLIKDGALIAYASASGTTYAIPNGVTKIRDKAFNSCSSLKIVIIPNRVTEIVGEAFYGCSSLKEFKGKYAADKGRCLVKDGVLIAYASASGEVYAIPNGVNKIGKYAFGGCSNLTSVTIPNSVTEIGVSAFNNCKSLTSITIPNSVTVIGWSAFSGCSSLTSITIPDSVTEIGGCAFRYCSSLTSVTIPNSVTKIETSAFQYCSKLKNVDICNEKGCVDIGYHAFEYDVKVTYLGEDAQPKKKDFFVW